LLPQVTGFSEQLQEVLNALTLNKSLLAQVFQVTRPTIYEWLSGNEPNVSNQRRVFEIAHALVDEGISTASPLGTRLVRHPLSSGQPSILELLTAGRVDVPALRSALRSAREASRSTDAGRIQREDRLRALGYEDPSKAEATERLGTNTAALEWPKPS
jgi:predicted transcriptional regulator